VGFTAFGRRVSFALQDSQGLRSEVEVEVALTTSNGLAIREWAIEGVRLARLPDFAVAAALAAGHLVRVLPGHTAGAPALSVAYLPERFRPANVRRLTDFAQDWFAKRRSPSR